MFEMYVSGHKMYNSCYNLPHVPIKIPLTVDINKIWRCVLLTARRQINISEIHKSSRIPLCIAKHIASVFVFQFKQRNHKLDNCIHFKDMSKRCLKCIGE